MLCTWRVCSTDNSGREAEETTENAQSSVWNRRTGLVVAFIAVLVAASVVTVLGLNLFNIVNLPSNDHFTIVMTDQGFNNSKARYPTPWPVMNVRKGDSVSIHVENDDPNGQPHAFVITHYFPSGIKLAAGQSDDISFTANQAGSFLVYCNILCTPHTYMLNGQLNVT